MAKRLSTETRRKILQEIVDFACAPREASMKVERELLYHLVIAEIYGVETLASVAALPLWWFPSAEPLAVSTRRGYRVCLQLEAPSYDDGGQPVWPIGQEPLRVPYGLPPGTEADHGPIIQDEALSTRLESFVKFEDDLRVSRKELRTRLFPFLQSFTTVKALAEKLPQFADLILFGPAVTSSSPVTSLVPLVTDVLRDIEQLRGESLEQSEAAVK